jgi:hypothetical protein
MFPHDPFHAWVYWQHMVSPYGPAWLTVRAP